jgi:hypothetical protein
MGISMLKVSPIPMIPSCEISSENFVTSYLKEGGKGNQLLVSYDFICTPFVPRTHNNLILNTSYFLHREVKLQKIQRMELLVFIQVISKLTVPFKECNQ